MTAADFDPYRIASWISHPAWSGSAANNLSREGEAKPVLPRSRNTVREGGAKSGLPRSRSVPERGPVLRRVFSVPSRPERAVLHVIGAGVWAGYVNGRSISENRLEPGISDYAKRVALVSVDITELLVSGENVVVLELGEGMASVRRKPGRYTKFVGRRLAPQARILIELDHRAHTEMIGSDDRWTAALGPTISHWYGGEDYDARLVPDGWPTDTDGGALEWVPAEVVGDATTGPEPWDRQAPPIRVVERWDPVNSSRPLPLPGATGFAPSSQDPVTPGVVVFDCGVNFAGRQVLTLSPEFPADVRVEMWPGEYVDPDSGRVNQKTTGQPISDSYTSAGGAAEWAPSFVYHGFRYLEVRIIDEQGNARPDLADAISISVERMMTDDRPAGRFTCSDNTLNEVYTLVHRAATSNLYSVLTDCPHREKLGWLEVTHLMFEPLAHLYDIHAHFSDLITHMCDSQTDDGLIPDIAPEFVEFDLLPGFRDDINWGGAIWLVPDAIYRTYGDLAPAREAWNAGVRYLEYIAKSAGDDILDHGLGDWIALDESTPRTLVSGYGHVRALNAAARLAIALGRPDDGDRFATDADRITGMIRERFVSSGGPTIACGSGSQASYALLADLGVFSETELEQAVGDLVAAIEANGHQITVGEIALPALIRTLAVAGEHDVWYRMATNPDAPSYGRMLADGCTALTEAWTGTESGISANHVMLGYVLSWLTGSVGGLRQADDSIGWRRGIVQPALVGDVTSASVTYDSHRGRFAVDWELGVAGDLHIAVEVPESAEVEVRPPSGYQLDDASQHYRLGPGTHRVGMRAADGVELADEGGL